MQLTRVKSLENHVLVRHHVGSGGAHTLTDHYVFCTGGRPDDPDSTLAAGHVDGESVGDFVLNVERITETGDWIDNRDQFRRRTLCCSPKKIESSLSTSATLAIAAQIGGVTGMNTVAVGESLGMLCRAMPKAKAVRSPPDGSKRSPFFSR